MRWPRGLSAVGAVALLGWVVVHRSGAPAAQAPLSSIQVDQEASELQRQSRGLVAGEELLVVFIGASFCQAAQVPGFTAAFNQVKRSLRAQADARQQQTALIGVAVDWDPAAGLRWLNNFGSFDEVVSGRNWLNMGAVGFIWRDSPGPSALPQIVVLKRIIQPGERTILVGKEEVLLRKLGSTEIMAWAEAGSPLPD